ncbi:PREDICTED: LOW QUALITY PROTEIN: DEP domain-containing protein 5-like [Acropora digitifera]|uniref:LOW QUALITY PROTEIN: DEP domain-containing protein 5-like n=1 Tax=Acropora digitifera TaxID=70779 RepID=UPI00077B1408|nr:PREDICTED: LOW QUALITY PROTEIN: DEP domain-containing protein 5-like [Acropora digitifera]
MSGYLAFHKESFPLFCHCPSLSPQVVFRSCSSKLYLFIQMSKEMWDFDFNGDLFFEKAINGFLRELFTKWKDLKVNHDVSIILFSRTFYDAQSIGDFPSSPSRSIQQDPYGRFYEDFYQVVALSERQDDWIPVLVTLKQCFNQYPTITGCSGDTSKGGNIIGSNSSSLDGNFLEAINLSMNGVSIDLVCLAEQPLHTVPLLKYFNKVLGKRDGNLADNYNIPHWMNHNFYASSKTRNKGETYVPRIKVPEVMLNSVGRRSEDGKEPYTYFTEHDKPDASSCQLLDLVDYDEYDKSVFRNPSRCSTKRGFRPRGSGFKRIGSALEMTRMAKSVSKDEMMFRTTSSPSMGVSSFDDVELNSSSSGAVVKRDTYSFRDVDNRTQYISSSVECTSQGVFEHVSKSTSQCSVTRPVRQRFAVSSADADPSLVLPKEPVRPQRTLINPFKPNQIPCHSNWTCNKHRWSQVFATGPDGEILHRHYHKLAPANDAAEKAEKPEKSRSVEEAALVVVAARKREMSEASRSISEDQVLFEEAITSGGSDDTDEDNTFSAEEPMRGNRERFSPAHAGALTSQQNTPRRRTLPRIYNPSRKGDVPVENDWTAAVKTSVDWKSMTCPALLPLTTDYCPSKKALESDYVESNYKLFIEEEEDLADEMRGHDGVHDDDAQGTARRLSAEMIFTELVSQRIRKGFLIAPKSQPGVADKPQSFATIPVKSDVQTYFLSIGRISHKLTLTSPEVTVIKYRPRHLQVTEPKSYSYRLWIPQRQVFKANKSRFLREEIDSYNWNYLDQHICGDTDFDELIEPLDYWKARFLVLPFSQRKLPQADKNKTPVSFDDNLMEGFLKFLEVLNRIKRFQKATQSQKERRSSEPCYPSRRFYKQHDMKASSPLPSELLVIRENASLPGTPLSSRSRSPSSSGQEFSSVDSRSSSSQEQMSEQLNGAEDLPAPYDKDRIIFHSLETLAEAMMDTGCYARYGHCTGKMLLPMVSFCVVEIMDTSKFPVPHRSSIDVERSEFNLLRAFQTEWFEVALWGRKMEEDFPEFLATDHSVGTFEASYPNLKRGGPKSARRNSANFHLENGCNCVPAYKFVNLDADYQRKSQRPESCTVRYHGNFCPLHAFEIELHWIAATGGIVNDMVQSWTRKASSCGLHIVPVPVSPFPDPVGKNVEPFRLPVFIPLNLTNCTSNGSPLFQEFDPASQHFRMFLFLEAILQRFGFIRDSPFGSMHVNAPMVQFTPVQCRENDYVHTSGVAFVRILTWEEDDDPFGSNISSLEGSKPCTGFHWMPNYMLTKRWRSAATGDKDASSKLRSKLEDFCADDNGVLTAFWESCKEKARKAAENRLDEEEITIPRDTEIDRTEQNRNEIGDSPEVEKSDRTVSSDS